jgi:hypothetical protein
MKGMEKLPSTTSVEKAAPGDLNPEQQAELGELVRRLRGENN